MNVCFCLKFRRFADGTRQVKVRTLGYNFSVKNVDRRTNRSFLAVTQEVVRRLGNPLGTVTILV